MQPCHYFNNSTDKILQSLFKCCFLTQNTWESILCAEEHREKPKSRFALSFPPTHESAASLAASLFRVRNQPYLSKMQHTSLYYPRSLK